MGRLEKQIIIGALALVGVLLTVVVLKGLQPRDDQTVDLGAGGEWERTTPQLNTFGGANGKPLSLDDDVAPASDLGGEPAKIEPAVSRPEPEQEPAVEEPSPAEADSDDGTREYVVKDGEVLSLIAQRELGSIRHMKLITDLNPHIHPSGDNINPGDVLKLPSRAAMEAERATTPAQRRPELAGVRVHEVVSGDSLWSLAQKYYGDGSQRQPIIKANPELLKNGEDTTLRLGWNLVIPE